MLIGAKTAEELKINIGGVIPRPEVVTEEIKGRCMMTGLPKTVQISSAEIVKALREPAQLILENVHAVLERTPPELIGDLGDNGIILSGGGAMIYGMDVLIERSTGIPTVIVDDPTSCAAYGAGRMLSRLDNMQDGRMNFLRRRQLKA